MTGPGPAPADVPAPEADHYRLRALHLVHGDNGFVVQRAQVYAALYVGAQLQRLADAVVETTDAIRGEMTE